MVQGVAVGEKALKTELCLVWAVAIMRGAKVLFSASVCSRALRASCVACSLQLLRLVPEARNRSVTCVRKGGP